MPTWIYWLLSVGAVTIVYLTYMIFVLRLRLQARERVVSHWCQEATDKDSKIREMRSKHAADLEAYNARETRIAAEHTTLANQLNAELEVHRTQGNQYYNSYKNLEKEHINCINSERAKVKRLLDELENMQSRYRDLLGAAKNLQRVVELLESDTPTYRGVETFVADESIDIFAPYKEDDETECEPT